MAVAGAMLPNGGRPTGRDRSGPNKEVEVAVPRLKYNPIIVCYYPADLKGYRVTPIERQRMLKEMVKIGVLQASVLKQIDMAKGTLRG